MMNSEDARSDFVLAAAGAVLIPYLADLARSLPGYPSDGSSFGTLLAILWLGLTMMFVPIVIGRHREEGLAAYSLAAPRDPLPRVAIIAIPVILLGFLRAMSLVGPLRAVVGRFGIPQGGTPALAAAGFDPIELVLRIAYIGTVGVGALVLIGFLVNRAPDAFRSPDLPVVEGLRTYGMGAAGASVFFGLLAVVSRGVGMQLAIGASVALAATILIADRFVVSTMHTTRAAILAPAIASAVFHVLSTGGILGGDLVLGLWLASLGFGIVVVAASLARTGATAIAFAVPIVVTSIYPTCISAVSAIQSGSFCGG